jgi:hypothetical protein
MIMHGWMLTTAETLAGAGSCTPRLSSLGRLSTPKALGRLKAMIEGSADSVTPGQVEEAGDVLSA